MPDDSPNLSRRELLQAGAALGAAGVVPAGAAAKVAGSEVRIPAPFDQVPVSSNRRRRTAGSPASTIRRMRSPGRGRSRTRTTRPSARVPHVVPEWAFEAARWRLDHANDPGRGKVEMFLMEYAYVRERFVTPDGHDAVDFLLQEADDGE